MDTARKTFELNNNVNTIDPIDELYQYSREDEQALVNSAPWKQDPHYFHTVKISAVALIKMVIHARSGGQFEIMGVMYGKIRDGTFWIMDATPLPVQGTETRVNAGNEALEYMVQFQDLNEQAGRGEMLRGWYHSHPGYGCWLSGIDVATQSTNQQFSDPYLAVVIDPNRTVSAGKVDIGAFRTYPEGYTPPATSQSSFQSVPMDKIKDFGVHANEYYQLKIEIYRTKVDEQILNLLWNKYWVSTLSQSLLLSNRQYATSQIEDLSEKLADAAKDCDKHSAHIAFKSLAETNGASKGKRRQLGDETVTVEDVPTPLANAAREGSRIAAEAQNGMVSQAVKDKLFNTPTSVSLAPEQARAAAQGVL